MKANMNNYRIGQTLQYYRKMNNLTQEDMATFVGITKNHLSGLERGLHKLSLDYLLKYCSVCNVTPNDILGFSNKNILPELLNLLNNCSEEEQRKIFLLASSLFDK